jgi:hypothetical protein
MYVVETSVKGATRINRREFATHAEAEAFAARWRRSNSTGDYVAYVSEVRASRAERILSAEYDKGYEKGYEDSRAERPLDRRSQEMYSAEWREGYSDAFEANYERVMDY